MKIKTNEIKVVSNPRSDFGNMEELVASIKEKGILEPILIDKDNNLIAGGRRLLAAQNLKLDKVPVRILEVTTDAIAEIKLVENMQRKDLNPIEEALSFKKYMDETITGPAFIAKKLGKPVDYIQRRIALMELSEDSKKALIKRKIGIGHAVVLAKLSSKHQKEAVKEIVEYGTSANNISDSINQEAMVDLDKAVFCKKECKNCKYNTNEQTFLIDLEDDNLKGNCFAPACYNKKTNEWIKAETKKLTEKGIVVMEKEAVEKIPGSSQIHDYYNDGEYKKALKGLEKKPDMYVVVFDNEYGRAEKEVWQIKKEEQKDKSTDEIAEDTLNLNRTEKLQSKIGDYKRDVLIDKTRELLKPGTKVLALALREAIESNHCNEFKDEALEALGLAEDSNNYVKKILNLDIKEIKKGFTAISKIAVAQFNDLKELEVAAEEFGFEWKDHFVMDEDFLNLYTKDQMVELAKECKMEKAHIDACKNNAQIKELIIQNWKKGQVPKILV